MVRTSLASYLELTNAAIFRVLATSVNPHSPDSYHLGDSVTTRVEGRTSRLRNSKPVVTVEIRRVGIGENSLGNIVSIGQGGLFCSLGYKGYAA